jgi:hypothetical protein
MHCCRCFCAVLKRMCACFKPASTCSSAATRCGALPTRQPIPAAALPAISRSVCVHDGASTRTGQPSPCSAAREPSPAVHCAGAPAGGRRVVVAAAPPRDRAAAHGASGCGVADPPSRLLPTHGDPGAHKAHRSASCAQPVDQSASGRAHLRRPTLTSLVSRVPPFHPPTPPKSWTLAHVLSSGVLVSNSELALFQLAKDAKHPRFKEISALVKEGSLVEPLSFTSAL